MEKSGCQQIALRTRFLFCVTWRMSSFSGGLEVPEKTLHGIN